MEDFIGKVIRKPFATGSKSEHDAVLLKTDSNEYVLRRPGGNPFKDPVLEKLVGKTIQCSGEATDYTLTIGAWKEVDT
jgi:hypothetical protein